MLREKIFCQCCIVLSKVMKIEKLDKLWRMMTVSLINDFLKSVLIGREENPSISV